MSSGYRIQSAPMTKTSPTLALDLSSDAATLQQLAFDGHWHEMARAGFSEIGLAEKMAFMRRVAIRLEGRGFRNVIWLPAEQVVTRSLQLPEGEPALREAAARTALATITKHPADDFVVRLGADDENGFTHVVGLRRTTMQEARRFATSHGFRADSFTAQLDFAGFGGPIYFQPPPDRQRQRKLVAIAAAAVLLVGASLAGLWLADPLGWRATPTVLAATPAAVESDPAPDTLSEVPPTETATADPVNSVAPPVDVTDIVEIDPEITDQAPILPDPTQTLDAIANVITTPVDLAAPDTQFAEILQTPGEDLPPTADLTDQAVAETAAAAPAEITPEAAPAPVVENVTSAAIAPAPALPTPWSALAAQLPPAEATLPQTEPPEPATQPEAVAVAPEPALPDPFAVVAGMPDFAPLLRDGTALPQAQAQAQAVPVIAETDAANNGVTVILGRPEFDPLLRNAETGAGAETGAEPAPDPVETVPETGPTEAITPETQAQDDAALIAARAIRPARRPDSFAEEAVQSIDILSGAAPRTAIRAVHRSANFTAQIAPLLASASAAASTSAPALPPEPQTVSLPSSASVQRAATIENALNMREVALIGIYGTADDRRALIRLASGRYIRLTLGETFSGGWRIIAMDETSVRVQKGNRTEILRVIQ